MKHWMTTLATLITSAGLLLTGCSDGGGDEGSQSGETWPGQPVPYDGSSSPWSVGMWEGDAQATTVECSGDESAPTMTISSPDGDVATIEPGPPVTLTVQPVGAELAEWSWEIEAGSTAGELEIDGVRAHDEAGNELPPSAGGSVEGRWTCAP